MRVLPVTNYNNYQKNVNFKGLWGRTSCRAADFDKVLNVPVTEYTYYYYPFKDESRDEVKKNSDETETAKIVYTNGKPRYEIHDFKEAYTFPFTKAEYENYLVIPTVDPLSYEEVEKLNTIREHLKRKFTDKEYGTTQTPADTSKIKQPLKEMWGDKDPE